MANTLFLRLEGSLQSWGERGRWSVRDSALTPTKSGVIGLVACAMGLREDEPIRNLSEKTRMGVRVDKAGELLTDYHTIGGGYDFPTLLEATGKPKKTPKGQPHTEISLRDYLADASFLVALQSADSTLIQTMVDKLQDPVWPVFLGRKSCIPSRPVYDGIGTFTTLRDALSQWNCSIFGRTGKRFVQIEVEDKMGTRRRDNVRSRQYRTFDPRYVAMQTIDYDEEVRNVSL